MNRPIVRLQKLAHCSGLPQYQTSEAAGSDLRASFPKGDEESILLFPGKRAMVPCGFKMALEPGWEAQIRARSGNAIKHGISMINGVGTIDSDYRGEVTVLLVNHGLDPFAIRHGDRIAQMIIQRAPQAVFEEVDELPQTERGEAGFGSTGLKGGK